MPTRILVLDLETVAQSALADQVLNAPFDEDAFQPKNGAKNPDVIARQLEDARRAWEGEKYNRVDSLALSPRTGRVLVVGCNEYAHCAENEQDERALLEILWTAIDANDLIVGFNSMSFDLPYAIVRSALLGVKLPGRARRPNAYLRRYSYTPHCDVRMMLCNWDMRAPGTRAEWAQAFGFPAQRVSGADVGKLHRAGDYDAIRAHCVADMQETREMFVRLSPFFGVEA